MTVVTNETKTLKTAEPHGETSVLRNFRTYCANKPPERGEFGSF